MRKRTVLERSLTWPALLGGILTLASASPRGVGWQNVTSAAGRFSVAMPGTPKASTGVNASGIRAHEWIAVQSSFICTMQYFDVSPARLHAVGPGQVLKDATDRSVHDLKGKLLYNRAIALTGFSGSEIVISLPNAGKATIVAERIYLVRNRIYVLRTDRPASVEDLNGTTAERFLDSFKLLSR